MSEAIAQTAPAIGKPAGGPPAGGPPKGKPVTKKQIIGLFAGLALGVVVFMIPISGLEYAGHLQLALTLGALVWWAMGALPAPVTAALYMCATIVFNVAPAADVFGAWYRGCNPWIVIAAFLIAAGVERTGLGKRIAYAICSMNFIKGYKSLIAAIVVLEVVLALLIPSAFARTFLILVIVEEICRGNGVNDVDTRNLKFATFALSVPTMTLFLTAEAAINSIVAGALGGISWFGWFFQIGIPSLVFIVLMAVLFSFIFKPTGEISINTTVCKERLSSLGKVESAEIKMVVWLAVLLLFWAFADRLGIKLEIGTLFITFLMFIPGIGCINMGALESISLGTLVFVTCTVAIGTVGGVTGMNAWIANTLLPATFPNNPILIVLFVAVICIIVHMLVGSVMATTAVIVPILMSFAATVPSVSAALVVYVGFHVVASHFLLSMHQATLATGLDRAGFDDKMCLKLGLPLTILVLVQALIDLGWMTIIGLA